MYFLMAFLFFAGRPLLTHAQKQGHYIKDNLVVFIFNPEDYEHFARLKSGKFKKAEKVKVKRVSISGNFNNWNKNGVEMTPLGDGIFVHSQPLSIFEDQMTWDFKYVVNKKFWAEPDVGFVDKVAAGNHPSGNLRFHLQLNTFRPDRMGNQVFRLEGFHDASQVVLTGSFNNWSNHALPMEKTDYGWSLTLNLEPGFYEYKFIVDGRYISDPSNPYMVKHNMLGEVSVQRVTREVRFFLNTHKGAQKVAVAGTFNNWQPDLLFMERTPEGWELKVELTRGKHHYKFVVDNSWITDPSNPVQEYDDKGNINSVIVVN